LAIVPNTPEIRWLGTAASLKQMIYAVYNHMENVDVDRKIILKCISQK
jgi:hypothetical protein